MEWVEEFYGRQNEWFGIYLGDIEERDTERADLTERLLGTTKKSILELGAGGGQTAVCLAQRGHEVTIVELLEDSVQHAFDLAHNYDVPMGIVQGDFYKVDFEEPFDALCYFDSFGIGTDADQKRLIKRIDKWLKPGGQALIEVGATWFWGGIAKNVEMDMGDCVRRYEFDPNTCRFIDKWWLKEDPSYIVHQSLRCYTPTDFALLLENTALEITHVEAGGTVDFENMEFKEKVELSACMTYYLTLTKQA